MNLIFILAIGIGFVAGLRSLTAPTVVAWVAHLGWLHLQGSFLAILGSTGAVVLLTAIALGELVADKLPMVPRRTAIVPLLVRIFTGALSAACLCVSAGYSMGVGILLGGIGGIVGAFAGYEIRKRLVQDAHIPDFMVALAEDVFAIGLAVFIVSH